LKEQSNRHKFLSVDFVVAGIFCCLGRFSPINKPKTVLFKNLHISIKTHDSGRIQPAIPRINMPLCIANRPLEGTSGWMMARDLIKKKNEFKSIII